MAAVASDGRADASGRPGAAGAAHVTASVPGPPAGRGIPAARGIPARGVVAARRVPPEYAKMLNQGSLQNSRDRVELYKQSNFLIFPRSSAFQLRSTTI